jgi:CSLREA domain-containing protein
MRLVRFVFCFFLLSALALFFSAVSPTTHATGARVVFTVNTLDDSDDGSCDNRQGGGIGNRNCTLREAINAANANAPVANTIKFSRSGTITLGATLPTITDDLTINGSGQAIIVSGNDTVRVLVVQNSKSLTLKNLTIAHGKCASCDGGGIYNDGGTVNVFNSTFSDNAALGAGGGAGIFSNGGTVNVTKSIFSGNTATYDGGGIYPYGATLNVTQSTFSGNTVGRSGGGIHAYGTLNVIASTFSGNLSDSGGGIYNAYGVVNVANSTFSNNGGVGGGLAGIPGGGGILNYSGVFYVSSSTFSGNYGEADTGTIRNELGTLTIKNTIITHTIDLGDCYNSGTLIGINNLVDDSSCLGSGSSSLGRVGAVTAFDSTLRDNGGTTKTHAISSASNAVNAVTDCTYVSSVSNPLFANGARVLSDQRGVKRPQGRRCDVGAYELRHP